MLRAISGRLSPAITLGAATRTATANGTGVDVQGFGALSFQLAIGVGGITFDGTNRIELSVEHSDDNSSWSAVAQTDISGATVTGSGVIRILNAAKAAADVTEVDYIGNRRYARVTATFFGTHATGTPISVVGVRALPDLMPA